VHIKPYDGAISTSPASQRPGEVGQLTAKTLRPGSDHVSLSSAVQDLASALKAALPRLDPARLSELLTPRDRFLLTRALEIVRAENLEPGEVRNLVLDLYRYRAIELAEPQIGAQLSGHASSVHALEGARRSAPPLSLPSFAQGEEAIAREILSSLPRRDTSLDREFVRALLDPARQPGHAVDFAFLRRLVHAVAGSDGSSSPLSASLAPRLARAALADAITALTLTQADLPATSPEISARGRALLNARLSALPESVATTKPLVFSLRANDRALLGVLYLAAEARGLAPSLVDQVARGLIALRAAESAERSARHLPLPSSAPDAARAASGQAAQEAETSTSALPLADGRLPALLQPRLPRESRHSFEQLPRALDAAAEVTHEAQRARESGDEASSGPRAYGSFSQIAAKVRDSYRSLAPIALPTELVAEQLATTRALEATPRSAQQATVPLSVARPLDLSQALGLGALIAEMRRQAGRGAQRLRQRQPSLAIRAVAAAPGSAGEAEADDPIFDDSRRRRRSRWHLLVERRRHKRRHKPL
jgi:hypothetical protein